MKTYLIITTLLTLGWSVPSLAKVCNYKKGTANYTIDLQPNSAEISYGYDSGATGHGGVLKYDFTMADGTIRYSNNDFFILSVERSGQTLVRVVDRKTFENIIEFEPCLEGRNEEIKIICKVNIERYEILVTEERLPVPGSDMKKVFNFLTYNEFNQKTGSYELHFREEMFMHGWAGGPPSGPPIELPYLSSASGGLELYKRTVGADTMITLISPQTKTTYFENLKCSN